MTNTPSASATTGCEHDSTLMVALELSCQGREVEAARRSTPFVRRDIDRCRHGWKATVRVASDFCDR
jgi:hypothetical protein